MLDTNLDPKRPWNLETDIPVFSLALAREKDSETEWLVFAHSPLENRQDVEITIPNFGEITVDVSRQGSFYLVSKTDGSVRTIGE